MQNDQQTQPAEKPITPPMPTEVQTHGHKDDFLQLLVSMINQSGAFTLDITLLVGGFLVSGKLIAADIYYERFANSMASIFEGTSSETVEAVRQGFSARGQAYKDQRTKQEKDNSITTYIHLENCTVGDATSRSQFQVLWRGRISEVAGFFLGSMRVSR